MKIGRSMLALLAAGLFTAGLTLAGPGDDAKQPAPSGAAPAPAGPSAAAAAAVALPPPSAHPPKELHFTAGHWTAWTPPAVPDGANPYVIVSGDTLWGLSGKFNQNPMLWPLLWDANRYIVDTHWIYPGDPLFVPAAPTVVPPGPIAAEAVQGEEGSMQETPPVAKVPEPVEPQPVALADTQDLYCSDYIDGEYKRPPMKIAEIEEPTRVSQGTGDVVYINQGAKQGVSAGDEFDIIHPRRDVRLPRSGRTIGTLVERRGRVKVLAVQPDTATAVITFACTDVNRGDRLLPRWDPEVPMGLASEWTGFQRYGAAPSGKADGLVIATPFDVLTAGQGQVVQVTLGTDAGLKPGDRLTVYRPNHSGPAYERYALGTAVVVTTRPHTAAVKLMESAREIYVGDHVEIQ